VANINSDQPNPAAPTSSRVTETPQACRLIRGNNELMPALPAAAEALVLLQALLDEPWADLSSITETIRGDIGLTVNAFQLAARDCNAVRDDVLSISEVIVHLGVNNLKAMMFQVPSLADIAKTSAQLDKCERFWMRARLTALIAEALASKRRIASREGAYLAGLLRHLGSLPHMLGLDGPDDPRVSLPYSWELPAPLADVVRGERNACRTEFSYSLLQLADEANKHAFRLELGYH